MHRGLIAKVEIGIHAPIAKVWDALVNPETNKRYPSQQIYSAR